jgi:hypothetical protein
MTHNQRIVAAAKRACDRMFQELVMLWQMIRKGLDLTLTFESAKHRYWAHYRAVIIAEERAQCLPA